MTIMCLPLGNFMYTCKPVHAHNPYPLKIHLVSSLCWFFFYTGLLFYMMCEKQPPKTVMRNMLGTCGDFVKSSRPVQSKMLQD